MNLVIFTSLVMNINKNKQILLIIVFIIAAITRIAFLGIAPNAFSVDEASNGYDAYSIMMTGKDRYGEFMPLFFRALDDYRESTYILLTVPFIKIFGLNEFATRLPAAICGTLTVVVVYLLAKELFNNFWIAFNASLLLAINPWSIYLSRIAFRANLFPLLFSLAILFFVKSFKNKNYLIVSSLFFCISLHTYSAARVFVPLFVFILAIIFWKHLWCSKPQSLIAACLFTLFLSYLSHYWLDPEVMIRANKIGFITSPSELLLSYFSYYSPVFLFLRGDANPRNSLATIGIGQLHLLELITVIIGIFFLFKKYSKINYKLHLLWIWLFLYPIPAALAEPAQSIRSIIGYPLLAIISGLGLFHLSQLITKKYLKIFKIITGFLITISFIYFLLSYYNYSQYVIPNSAAHWQYGLAEAFQIEKNRNYDCVFVSNSFALPNIYTLFYSQYSPSAHQLNPTPAFPSGNYSLGKYQLVDAENIKFNKNKCLFIIKPEDSSKITPENGQIKEIKTIKTGDNFEKIKVLESLQ